MSRTDTDREFLRHTLATLAYRGGKTLALGFLVGQVMKATRGQANPGLVNELMRRELERA